MGRLNGVIATAGWGLGIPSWGNKLHTPPEETGKTGRLGRNSKTDEGNCGAEVTGCRPARLLYRSMQKRQWMPSSVILHTTTQQQKITSCFLTCQEDPHSRVPATQPHIGSHSAPIYYRGGFLASYRGSGPFSHRHHETTLCPAVFMHQRPRGRRQCGCQPLLAFELCVKAPGFRSLRHFQ